MGEISNGRPVSTAEMQRAVEGALEKMGVSQANMTAAGPEASDTTTNSTFDPKGATATPQISPELLKALFTQISTAQVDPTNAAASAKPVSVGESPLNALAKEYLKTLTSITAADIAAVKAELEKSGEANQLVEVVQAMPVIGGIISSFLKSAKSVSIGEEGDARIRTAIEALQKLQVAIQSALDSDKVASLLKSSTRKGLEQQLALDIKPGSKSSIQAAVNLAIFDTFQELSLKGQEIKTKSEFDVAAETFAKSINQAPIPQLIATRSSTNLLAAITKDLKQGSSNGGFLLNAHQALHDFAKANSISLNQEAMPKVVEQGFDNLMESMFSLLNTARAEADDVYKKHMAKGAPEFLRKVAGQFTKLAEVAEERNLQRDQLKNSLPVIPTTLA